MQPTQRAWLEIVSDEGFDPKVFTEIARVVPSAAWTVGDSADGSSGSPRARRRTSRWSFETDEVATYDSAVPLAHLRQAFDPVAALLAQAASDVGATVAAGLTIKLERDEDEHRGVFYVAPTFSLDQSYLEFLRRANASFDLNFSGEDLYNDPDLIEAVD